MWSSSRTFLTKRPVVGSPRPCACTLYIHTQRPHQSGLQNRQEERAGGLGTFERDVAEAEENPELLGEAAGQERQCKDPEVGPRLERPGVQGSTTLSCVDTPGGAEQGPNSRPGAHPGGALRSWLCSGQGDKRGVVGFCLHLPAEQAVSRKQRNQTRSTLSHVTWPPLGTMSSSDQVSKPRSPGWVPDQHIFMQKPDGGQPGRAPVTHGLLKMT